MDVGRCQNRENERSKDLLYNGEVSLKMSRIIEKIGLRKRRIPYPYIHITSRYNLIRIILKTRLYFRLKYAINGEADAIREASSESGSERSRRPREPGDRDAIKR